ncbi:MAG: ankyrin repeat domain-containing protein [Cytophagales bacterium]
MCLQKTLHRKFLGLFVVLFLIIRPVVATEYTSPDSNTGSPNPNQGGVAGLNQEEIQRFLNKRDEVLQAWKKRGKGLEIDYLYGLSSVLSKLNHHKDDDFKAWRSYQAPEIYSFATFLHLLVEGDDDDRSLLSDVVDYQVWDGREILCLLLSGRHINEKALVALLKMLTAKNININQPTKHGIYPLHHYIVSPKANIKFMLLLLKHGADIHTKDTNGDSALSLVMQNPTFVEMVLRYHPDVCTQNNQGQTCLHKAIRQLKDCYENRASRIFYHDKKSSTPFAVSIQQVRDYAQKSVPNRMAKVIHFWCRQHEQALVPSQDLIKIIIAYYVRPILKIKDRRNKTAKGYIQEIYEEEFPDHVRSHGSGGRYFDWLTEAKGVL